MNMGGRAIVTNYTPTDSPVNSFKASVKMAFYHAAPGAIPLEGPVRLEVLFIMPRPKRIVWKRRPMPRDWADTNPMDLDNLEKSVMDCLKQLAWKDDHQVVSKRSVKLFARGNEQPHCVIEFEACYEYLDVGHDGSVANPMPDSEYDCGPPMSTTTHPSRRLPDLMQAGTLEASLVES